MPRSENSTQQMILKRYACVPINLIKRRKVGRKLIRNMGKMKIRRILCRLFPQARWLHTHDRLFFASLNDMWYFVLYDFQWFAKMLWKMLKIFIRYTWILLFPNFSIFYFWNKREKKNFIKRIKREIYISKDIANIFLDV